MRSIRSTLLAALLPVFMAAPSHAAEPVTIGFFSHLSGNFAEYGASFKNAVELYLEQLDQKGGIEGRPVKLLVEDDRNSPQEAATVAR